MSLSYANHEDMVIVFHRSNFIYEILKFLELVVFYTSRQTVFTEFLKP